MTQSPARLLFALVVAALAVAAPARADYMDWSYSTSAVPPGFTATAANNGSGSVQLTPYTNIGTASADFGRVLAYQTTATAPVTFDATQDKYTLTMTITDQADPNNPRTLTFAGAIGGGLSPNGSNLTNTFTNASQSVTFDGHTYTVTLPDSMSLAGTTTPQQNILATIKVTDAGSNGGSGGGVNGTPEPTSLLLGGLGFSVMGLCGWRRRARRPETAGA